MKITFINPPFKARFSRESRSPAVAKSGTLYYPHWLAYAAAYSKYHKHEVSLFDGCATPVSTEVAIKKVIDEFSAEILVVSTSTPSVYSDLRFADAAKKACPKLRVFMVGPHVSATVLESFIFIQHNQLNIDGIIVGEFDQVVVDIAHRISNGDDFYKAAGLAYRDANGIIVENPKPPLLESLNDWPLVTELYKDFLDIPAYYYGHNKHPMVTVITGRGCYYRCTFCQLPQVMHGHDYRRRSVEDIVREFRYIHENLSHIRNIMIEDDTFTADKPHVREICKRLVEEGLTSIEWTCNARADVDAETLTWMKKAGCRMMCVGFESGDQEILDKMRKGTNLKRIAKFVHDAHDVGVKVHGCFMFGNKFETVESMQTTLKFALTLPLDTAQFFPIMVSPGTVDYEYFKQEGMLQTENFAAWNDEEGNHQSTINRPNLPNEIINSFCDYARRKFYLRPRYLGYKVKQSLTDYQEFKRNVMGFNKLLKHLVRPTDQPKVSPF